MDKDRIRVEIKQESFFNSPATAEIYVDDQLLVRITGKITTKLGGDGKPYPYVELTHVQEVKE